MQQVKGRVRERERQKNPQTIEGGRGKWTDQKGWEGEVHRRTKKGGGSKGEACIMGGRQRHVDRPKRVGGKGNQADEKGRKEEAHVQTK